MRRPFFVRGAGRPGREGALDEWIAGWKGRLAGLALAALTAAALAAGITQPAFAYEARSNVVAWGHGYNAAQYLVVHETANPGASAWNHVLYWSNNPAYAVHYVMELDGSAVYNTVPDDRLAWHVGNGNRQTVGIELAHATSRAQFESQWAEAVRWCGDYLRSRGWGADRLLSHDECRRIWGGTDHTDPTGYFAGFGRSWAEFEAAVAAYLGTGAAPEGSGSGGAESPTGHSPSPVDAVDGNGFGGTYRCAVGSLNVRSGPSLGYPAVASYSLGQTVVLDDAYVIADGYVWGRYTAWSGATRYIAVGRATGQVEPDDYLVKGGASVEVATVPQGASSGAGWRTVTADTLNVRAAPWGDVVASYGYGQSVYIEGSVWAGGMEWGRYTAWSGLTRYMSMDWLA